MNSYEDIIKNYISTAQTTDNVLTGDKITPDILKKHNYFIPKDDEKPLIVINKGAMIGVPFTGLVITDKSISYKLMKNSFWTGMFAIFMKPIISRVEWKGIEHFQIGSLSGTIGSAYTGHDFMINNEVYGILRLGDGLLYDDKMLTFINGLSEALFKQGLLQKAPK